MIPPPPPSSKVNEILLSPRRLCIAHAAGRPGLLHWQNDLQERPSSALHHEVLRVVLARLRDAGLEVNPVKCLIFQRACRFLGNFISAAGVEPDVLRYSAVLLYPRPTSRARTTKFCAYISYFSAFLDNVSASLEPLRVLANGTGRFEWRDEHQRSFDQLRAQLVNATALRAIR